MVGSEKSDRVFNHLNKTPTLIFLSLWETYFSEFTTVFLYIDWSTESVQDFYRTLYITLQLERIHESLNYPQL